MPSQCVTCPAVFQADRGLLALECHTLADMQEIVSTICQVHLPGSFDSLCAGDWSLLLQATYEYVSFDQKRQP